MSEKLRNQSQGCILNSFYLSEDKKKNRRLSGLFNHLVCSLRKSKFGFFCPRIQLNYHLYYYGYYMKWTSSPPLQTRFSSAFKRVSIAYIGIIIFLKWLYSRPRDTQIPYCTIQVDTSYHVLSIQMLRTNLHKRIDKKWNSREKKKAKRKAFFVNHFADFSL